MEASGESGGKSCYKFLRSRLPSFSSTSTNSIAHSSDTSTFTSASAREIELEEPHGETT